MWCIQRKKSNNHNCLWCSSNRFILRFVYRMNTTSLHELKCSKANGDFYGWKQPKESSFQIDSVKINSFPNLPCLLTVRRALWRIFAPTMWRSSVLCRHRMKRCWPEYIWWQICPCSDKNYTDFKSSGISSQIGRDAAGRHLPPPADHSSQVSEP